MATVQELLSGTKPAANPLTGSGSGSFSVPKSTVIPTGLPNLSGVSVKGIAPTSQTSTALTGNVQVPIVPKPVSVVSSKPASDTVNKAKTVTTASSTQPTYDSATGLLTPYGRSLGLQEVNAPKTETSPVVPPPPPTPEQQQTDAVLHEGQTQLYSTRTGQQEWVSTPTPGIIPAGYSSSDPKTAPAQDSFTSSDGFDYKQMADGTYAKYNPTTNTYQQINAGAYNAQKQLYNDTKALNDLKNSGILKPEQQAQVDALTAQYAALIKKQETANANATGGQTIAQNMYGMGNTMIGQGEITQVINDGIQKVSTLVAQQNSAIAQMKQGFLNDDMNAIKEGWSIYLASQAETQKELDALSTATRNAQIKQDNAYQAYALQQSGKYTDAGILPTDTPEEVDRKKIEESAIWKQEAKTKSGIIDQDVVDGMLALYKKTGVIPAAMGNAALPLKEAFYAALGGATGIIDNATANKAALTAATKALSTQRNQYEATKTSIETLKKSLDLIYDFDKKVDRTGSPIVNKYLLWLTGKAAGDKDVAGLDAAIITASTEYAKIMSGASASIAGVTVSGAQDVKDVLNSAMSKGQIDSVINVMKQDSNFRLNSYKGTIDQVTQDIRDLGKSDTSGSSQPTVPLTANTIW